MFEWNNDYSAGEADLLSLLGDWGEADRLSSPLTGDPEREREPERDLDSRLVSCPFPLASLRAGDAERDLLIFLSLLLERDLLCTRAAFLSFFSFLGDGERTGERDLDRLTDRDALRERERRLRRGERLFLRLRSLLRERLLFLLLRSLLRERLRFLSRLRERDLERERERDFFDERRGDLLPS